MTVQCEVVIVKVAEPDGSVVATLVIPAFTRPARQLSDGIKLKLNAYLERSKTTGDLVSTGDFALYLLSIAALEPREQ